MKRNMRMLVTASLFVPFLMLYGMFELYFNNSGEFWFTFGQMAGTVLPAFAAAVVVLLLIGLVLPSRIRYIYLVLLFAVGIAMYIQGNILRTDFGLLNGEDIPWEEFSTDNTISIIMWLVIIVGVLLFALLKKRLFCSVMPYVSMGICLVLTITLITVGLPSLSQEKKTQGVLTKKGEFELSEKENTVVFLLDAMDIAYTQSYFESHPEAIEMLDGFTLFSNTVGAYGYTMVAVPHILTGQAYLNEQPYSEYLEEAYAQSPLFDTLEKRGYEIFIYDNEELLSGFERFDNFEVSESYINNKVGFVSDLSKLVAFRYAPQPMKKQFEEYSTVLNPYRITMATHLQYPAYNDPEFYLDLKEQGLSVKKENPTFHYYHLFGAHPPYTMDGNGMYKENSSKIQQINGVWHIVLDYINQMKKKGIYDSSNIVILSDHGHDSSRMFPTLMIKRAGDTGKMKISDVPVSYLENLMPTLVDLVDGDHVADEKNVYLVSEILDETRYSYVTIARDERLSNSYYYSLYESEINKNKETVVFNKNVYSSKYENVDDMGQQCVLGKPFLAKDFDSLLGWGAKLENGSVYGCGSMSGLVFNISELPKKNLMVTVDVSNVMLMPGRIDLYLDNSYIGSAQMQATEGSMQFIIPRAEITSPTLMLMMKYENCKDIDPILASDQAKFSIKSITIVETELQTLPETDKTKIELFPPVVENGEKTTSGYTLKPEGYMQGFYFALPAGTYRLVVQGQNVSGIALGVGGSLDSKKYSSGSNYVVNDKHSKILEFTIPSTMTNTSPFIKNYGQDDAEIERIWLQRMDETAEMVPVSTIS